jgi:Mn2+/Fe2+ NRAMP family transporter
LIPKGCLLYQKKRTKKDPAINDQTKQDTDQTQAFYKIAGPGLITDASDDDPSGIATCSQAGAQSCRKWVMLFFCS